MLHLRDMLSLPAVSSMLAAFVVYWILRGKPAPNASLEERIQRLDRAMASMRGALLVFILGTLLLANLLVLSLSRGALWKVNLDSVKAKEIVLLGPDGEGPNRAALFTERDGVWFNLRDEHGKKRISLAVPKEGYPVVGVFDADEKPKGYLARTDDQTVFMINDGTGKPGAGFSLHNDGTMVFGRFGDDKPRMAMTFAQGMPILSLHWSSGKDAVLLSMIAADKRNCLEFRDEKGVKRLEIGLANDAPFINTFDADGKPTALKP